MISTDLKYIYSKASTCSSLMFLASRLTGSAKYCYIWHKSSKKVDLIKAYWFSLMGIWVTSKMKSSKKIGTLTISPHITWNKLLSYLVATLIKLICLCLPGCSLIKCLPSMLLLSHKSCKNLKALLYVAIHSLWYKYSSVELGSKTFFLKQYLWFVSK